MADPQTCTIEDLRETLRKIRDTQRTLVCCPVNEARVRAVVDGLGMAGVYTVKTSPVPTDTQIFMFNENWAQGYVMDQVRTGRFL